MLPRTESCAIDTQLHTQEGPEPSSDKPAFIWHVPSHSVAWANPAALDVWHVAAARDLIHQRQDRAMPGVAALARAASSLSGRMSDKITITLWTSGGAKQVKTRVSLTTFNGEDGHLLVEVLPDNLRDTASLALNSAAVAASGQALSAMEIYRSALRRNDRPAGDIEPAETEASEAVSPPPEDGTEIEGETRAEVDPDAEAEAFEDDARAMQEIAAQIRKALPFANGVETANRFFGYAGSDDVVETGSDRDNDPQSISLSDGSRESVPTYDAPPESAASASATDLNEPHDADADASTPAHVTPSVPPVKVEQSQHDPDQTALLAKLAHELRTPLNAIIGFSDLMREQRMGPLENETYLGYAQDIHHSAHHALGVISDLLDLARARSQDTVGRREPVQVIDVIEDAVAMIRPSAEAARLDLHVSVDDAMPELICDEGQLRQILLNLLTNAVKFTRARGEIIVAAGYIPGSGFVITVRDTGIGMSQAEIAEAMQPFRRVGAIQQQTEGSGLGLPLVLGLVKANGGQFTLSSSQGRGTLARIVFPERSDGPADAMA